MYLGVVGTLTIIYYKSTAQSALKKFLQSVNIWQSYG